MIPYKPDKPRRNSIRLKGYDYTQPGAYFITICVAQRECIFGKVVNGEMELNQYGKITADSWQWLSHQYSYVRLDACVIMPNHLHGIIIITDDESGGNLSQRGGSRTASTPLTIKRKPLGRLVGAFKTVSTKHINIILNTAGASVWQRDFYDRINRSEQSLDCIRQYIINNPLRWAENPENPGNQSANQESLINLPF